MFQIKKKTGYRLAHHEILTETQADGLVIVHNNTRAANDVSKT